MKLGGAGKGWHKSQRMVMGRLGDAEGAGLKDQRYREEGRDKRKKAAESRPYEEIRKKMCGSGDGVGEGRDAQDVVMLEW